MRRNSICLVLLFFIAGRLTAQLNESFNDGNFTADPVWNGNAASWQVISSDAAEGAPNSNTLRLNVATGSGTAYLSTQIMGSWGIAQSWGFFVGRRAQAFTASNYVLIWLWCNEADLTSATADGYRIRIGDDTGGDDIILQRVTDGVATNVLTSSSAITNSLIDIGFLLRITRNPAGTWEVFTSQLPVTSGSGAIATDVPNAVNASISQGSVIDNLYNVMVDGSIGFVNVHGSTTGARSAQEFDQVQVSFTSAVLPVKLQQLKVRTQNGLTRLSWQAIDETGVQQYEVQKSRNGIDFTVIDAVKAEQKVFYLYIDSLRATGNSFYRLRIIDEDGAVTFSYIVGTNIKELPSLSVFPNPARSIINMHHPAAKTNGKLLLMNVAGIPVKQMNLPEHAIVTAIDVSALSPGLYYVVFISGGIKLARSFIKDKMTE
jgi:hypothetical protein